jgi:hypothetical protein
MSIVLRSETGNPVTRRFSDNKEKTFFGKEFNTKVNKATFSTDEEVEFAKRLLKTFPKIYTDVTPEPKKKEEKSEKTKK